MWQGGLHMLAIGRRINLYEYRCESPWGFSAHGAVFRKLGEGGSSHLGAPAAPREIEGGVEGVVSPGQLDELQTGLILLETLIIFKAGSNPPVAAYGSRSSFGGGPSVPTRAR